jgi:hypothetical protein
LKLLSLGNTNAKTVKSDNAGTEYLTAILYLAPYTTAGGLNVCPKSSEGCRAACLFPAGRGVFFNVQNARVKKTKWYFEDRRGFLSQLATDIHKFVKRCNKLGKRPAIRLNGTSDILWEKTGIFSLFPEVQFYDYTKIAQRFYWQRPSNYHLTFSLHENNLKDAEKILENNLGNVAVVFKGQIPAQFLNREVVNGDETDLRFLDKSGVIVGLTAKGKARKDKTGFVVDVQI